MNLHTQIDNLCKRLHTMYDAHIDGDLEPFEMLLNRIAINIDRCAQYRGGEEQ